MEYKSIDICYNVKYLFFLVNPVDRQVLCRINKLMSNKVHIFIILSKYLKVLLGLSVFDLIKQSLDNEVSEIGL